MEADLVVGLGLDDPASVYREAKCAANAWWEHRA
jgi:hypothetical protein